MPRSLSRVTRQAGRPFARVLKTLLHRISLKRYQTLTFGFKGADRKEFRNVHDTSKGKFSSDSSFTISNTTRKAAHLRSAPPDVAPSRNSSSRLLDHVTDPTSIGTLTPGRLTRLYHRVHTALLTCNRRRNNRVNSGLNVIRTAITLRHMFSSPHSHVIFSMSRRDCIRGVLANHTTTCLSPSHFDRIANFAGPNRDGRSRFILNRANASVSLTYNLTGAHSVRNPGDNVNGIVTIVNSNSLDSNITFRKLGGTTRRNNGLVVIFGSGRVSVTNSFNNVCNPLTHLHTSNNATRPGLFGTFNLSCQCIRTNGSISTLITTFRRIHSVSRPIIIRVRALGNTKCSNRRARTSQRATSTSPISLSSPANIRPASGIGRDRP